MMVFLHLVIAILDLVKVLLEKTDKVREKAVAMKARRAKKARA